MRGIREEPACQQAVDHAVDHWPRGQDAWNTVTWVIARDPEVGKALTESGKTRSFTLQGARSIGLPTVTVIYVIEVEAISVQAARFQDAAQDASGRA